MPLQTVTIRRRRGVVAAAVVETIQVGVVTPVVPPATFAQNGTGGTVVCVIVLVSSAELRSQMSSQCVTFNQQTEH